MDHESGPTGGPYDYAGKTYRIVEISSKKWSVFDEETSLGSLTAASSDDGLNYIISGGNETLQDGELIKGDWRTVLGYLIDNTAPPVGA